MQADLGGMDVVTYHKYRTAVQQNAAPGDAGVLCALESRLHDALLRSGMFLNVESGHTDDPDALVIALGQFDPDLSEAEMCRRLEAVWSSELSYQFWEAHAILADDSQVELLGATRPDPRGTYVTVHIVAQRAGVPEQRVHG